MKQRILNDGQLPERGPELHVAAQLRSDINRLKGEFYDLEHGRVDYRAMRDSEAYRQYVVDTAWLREFDLLSLAGREEQLAFWINLYNTLVIHGVIEQEVNKSVKEVSRFFTRIAYRIGGMIFCPDDIEHGILRGNSRPPHRLLKRFPASDARNACTILSVDPRIHFTLVCASSSCPPINFYTPDRIEEQLQTAAEGFINGPEVEILPSKNLLRLSPIFNWYAADFGGQAGVIDLIAHHRDRGEEREFLFERGAAAQVEWKDYDWHLNR